MSNKEILIELLKKTFDERLLTLEKNTHIEIESLAFTKKEFDNFDKKIENLVKLRQEKELRDQLEKEIKEKEKADKLAKEEKMRKEKAEKNANKGRKTITLKSSATETNFETRRTIGPSSGRRTITTTSVGRKSVSGILNTENNTKPLSKRTFTPGRMSKVEPNTHSRNTINTTASKTLTKSKTTANLKKIVKKKTNSKIKQEKPKEEAQEEPNEEEVKNPFKEEEKKPESEPEEIPKIEEVKAQKANFKDFIDNQVFSKYIVPFLTDTDLFSLYSTNKSYFKGSLIELLTNLKEKINKMAGVVIGKTIDDKISELYNEYPSDALSSEPPEFTCNRGTTKAMELISEKIYIRIFQTNVKYLKQLPQIVNIYRIFCLFIHKDDLLQITDNIEFWKKFSEFVLDSEYPSLSAFFLENAKTHFKYNEELVYKIIRKYGPFDSSFGSGKFNKICPTTGLVSFLIKDLFEYCGIITDKKKTPPIIIKRNLEYLRALYERVDDYSTRLNIIIGI